MPQAISGADDLWVRPQARHAHCGCLPWAGMTKRPDPRPRPPWVPRDASPVSDRAQEARLGEAHHGPSCVLGRRGILAA
jgi:hypothetical protein